MSDPHKPPELQSVECDVVRLNAAEVAADLEPICEHAAYQWHPPGIYKARCTTVSPIYRDPRFRRWIVRLGFVLLPDGGRVSAFLGLGNGEKPKIARGSEYRRAWIIAHGEKPRRGDRMAKSVFLDKIFEVRIEDIKRRHDGRDHPEPEIYSRVAEIIKKLWP